MTYLIGEENVVECIESTTKGSVPIVFETSELFVPYLSVALLSLAATCSKKRDYEIIILSSELKKYHEAELEALLAEYGNIRLRFFNPRSIVHKYIEKARFQYLEINYYRIALAWILSKYDKAINLGADIIVEHDIGELIDEQIPDNCYMAGAPDLGYHGRLSIDISPDDLGLTDPYSYVNADVLLMNLKKIREDFDLDSLMNIWQKKQLMCAEQDALNLAFNEHVYHLNLKWNTFPERMLSEYHMQFAKPEHLKEWKQALRDPYIIHYAAVPKPWDYPLIGFGTRWWFYARRCPYYEEIIRRMCIVACRDENIVPAKTEVESDARKTLERKYPRGSRKRAIIEALAPWGTRRRAILKRIFYLFHPDKHSI